MRIAKSAVAVTIIGVLSLLFLISLPITSSAEVYLNKLWNENKQEFDIQALVVEGGGITLNRDYQNAYGELNNLTPGPPFIVESMIYARNINESDGTVINWGTLTIESGSLAGFLEPFTLYFQPEPNHETGIICDGSFTVTGSTLDPIKFVGVCPITIGHSGGPDPDGNGHHEHHIENLDLSSLSFSIDQLNYYPIRIQGGDVTIESCNFENFSNDFADILSFIDVYNLSSRPVWHFSMNNCRFKNNNVLSVPVKLSNLKSVTLTNNNFENNQFFTSGDEGVLRIDECGLKAIRNNVGSGNANNIFRVIEPWISDSAHIRQGDEIVFVSTAIEVPKDSALTIGPNTLIKFRTTGGIINRGRLHVKDAVLTCSLDDRFGGDTDMNGTPPYMDYWNAGFGFSAGIFIDSTGTADFDSCGIFYAEGAIHAMNDILLERCSIQNSNGFGFWLAGTDNDTYEINNCTVENTMASGYVPKYGIMLDNSSGHQQRMNVDSTTIYGGDRHGIYIRSMSGYPVVARITNSRILNNAQDGIYAYITPDIDSLHVSNCDIVGNGAAGIECTDGGGDNSVIEVENCFIAGNGEISAPRHGATFLSGRVSLVGNTIAHNNQVGAVFSGLDQAQSKSINNIFHNNGSYGFNMGDYGDMPILSNNVFWENDLNVYQVSFRTPAGVVRTIAEIQALGGEYATNQHADPTFANSLIGDADSVVYDSVARCTKLYADFAASADRDLLPSAVRPNTIENSWYFIVEQSEEYISLYGDATSVASAGDSLMLFDPHLSEFSLLIDAGNTTESRGDRDMDDQVRIIDGDENGSTLVDIGADEFDPNASTTGIIRVLEPTGEKLLVGYGSFNIEWQAADSIASVDIDYNTAYDDSHPDNGWSTIAAGTDATAGFHTWKIPGWEYSTACRIRIKSTAHADIMALSAPFKIKNPALTHVNEANQFVDYTHFDNSWPFANDSATMWPQTAWPNYPVDIDPVTGEAYSTEFTTAGTFNYLFPSWPIFVDAFGTDACYFHFITGYEYKPSAVLRWKAIAGEWGGSCYGLALTDLMAFVDSAAFADRDEVGTFDILHNLTMTAERRNLINRYHTYQYGRLYTEYNRTAHKNTVSETLDELRDMFGRADASDKDRIITICDTSTVNNQGCHAVMPYFLDQIDEEARLWALMVVDNNVPNDYPWIDIDITNGSWSYTWLGWSGDKLFFLNDPLSNYAGNAEMVAELSANRAVAAAEGYTEIYLSLADSVRLESGVGAVGRSGDSSYNSVSEAMPIVPSTGSPGKAIGYSVPQGDWSCLLTGAEDEMIHIMAFSDSMVRAYHRNGVQSGETDQVEFRGDRAIHLQTPEGIGRLFDIDMVLIDPDGERQLALKKLFLSASDSVSTEVTPSDFLQIANYGSESAFDVVLRDYRGSALGEFSHAGIPLSAGSRHQLEPNWADIAGDSMLLVIDHGMDGSFDDTLFVQNGSPTDVGDDHGSILPDQFELSQNYPNPFNLTTTIRYALPRASHVTISVHNLLGQLVQTLVDQRMPAGWHEVDWDGTSSKGQAVSSGVYFYRVETDDLIESRKMILLK